MQADFEVSPFQRYLDLLVRLDWEREFHGVDSQRADVVLDQMDEPWHALLPAEQQRISAIAVELNRAQWMKPGEHRIQSDRTATGYDAVATAMAAAGTRNALVCETELHLAMRHDRSDGDRVSKQSREVLFFTK
jgi:hypothetical protein